MNEIMLAGVATGISKFIGDIIFNGYSDNMIRFGNYGINGSIGYQAKLDTERRNFHMTIDLDINY